MPDEFEIKHKEPALRRMVADYRAMFSEPNLKLAFFYCVLLAVLLVVFPK